MTVNDRNAFGLLQTPVCAQEADGRAIQGDGAAAGPGLGGPTATVRP
jgi:hypothetical protein